ncbi:MAG: hypothetical protein EH225_00410 [Calditrichaeota bacterium]|nr:hypothetical protein [Calditrichota bacterium]RQW08257.1 MAG: hypothetical protein EH225_00410 [Calditrichota bacterium]
MNLSKNILLIFICTGTLPFLVPLQAQPVSNLDVLDSLLVEPIVQSIDSLISEDTPLMLQNEVDSPVGKWLFRRLRLEFLQRGMDVRDSGEASPPDSHYTLILDASEIAILYRGIDTDLLFRTTRYRRTIETMLSFYIRNNHESIIHSHSKTENYSDTVSRSQLNEIENKMLDFTRGEKTGSTLIQKIFEPAVVTVATLGVVYLFFSLRSGS